MNSGRYYKKDILLSRLILSYFIVSALNATIKNVFNVPDSMRNVISLIGGCFILLYFIGCFKYILMYSGKLLILSYLGILLIFVSSIFIREDNDIVSILNSMSRLVFMCIPMGLAIFAFTSAKELYKMLLKYSYLLSIILSLIVIFPAQQESYNMFLSYALALPLLMHINECFKKTSFGYFIISLIELFVIILCGSRGALLSIAFMCLFNIFRRFRLTVKSCTGIFIICLTCILIYGNISIIGDWILSKLSEYNIYSRTITLMFNDEIVDLSGREGIWDKSIYMIFQKPILGWGYAGWLKDFILSYGEVGGDNTGIYPHNIFLELCLDYGLIIGSLSVIVLLLSFFRSFYIRDEERDLLVILFALGVIPLFLSGTYTASVVFFLYLYFFMFTLKHNVVIKSSRL